VTVDSTHIGTIADVSGASISATLLPHFGPGLAFVAGHSYRLGQPGSLVRIPIGFSDLFGVVSQVGASAIPERLASTDQQSQRWLTIQLIGEGTPAGGFSRGISQYPSIGDSVHLVTLNDLRRVYGRPGSKRYIPIGQVASAESIPALVDINRLITRHSAILGSTGSGKSTAVAGILNRISSAGTYPSARILLIDMHGEYASALRERATVFRVGARAERDERQLLIPYWALEFEELMSLAFGSVSTEVDRGGLLEHVREAKLSALTLTPRAGVSPQTLNVDTPVPFSIHALWLKLHLLIASTHLQTGGQSERTVAYAKDALGAPLDRGDAMAVRPPKVLPQDTSSGATPKVYLSQNTLNIRRQLEGLAFRLRDSRYDFLFRPGPWLPDVTGRVASDLDALLKDWLECDRPITVLDLSGIPREVLNILVGALLRITYDSMFWARNLSEGARERPLLIVMEEAHAYVGKDDAGPAARMVRRIVREGRKYGIGAMVISQRPSEIDPTILSQCGTLVAMRLNNSQDRSQVSASSSDNLEGLFSLLPILRTGEAIVVGEAVHVPTRVLIEAPTLDRRPESADPNVFEESLPGGWNRSRESSNYGQVVEAWRGQDPRVGQYRGGSTPSP
jgi:hypothetical protein